MNRPSTDRLISEADALALLRAADPAPAAGSPAALDERARTDLAAILRQTPPPNAVPAPVVTAGGASRPAPRRPVGHRTRGWVRPLLWAATPVAATVTVAVVLITSAAQPRGAELASWTPVPSTTPGAHLSPERVQDWTSRCTDLTGAAVGVGGAHLPSRAAHRQVLVDQRGSLTYCVDYYRGADTDGDPTVVLSGLRGTDVEQTAVTVLGSGSPAWTPPTGGDVLVMGGDSTTHRAHDQDGSLTDTSDAIFTQDGLAGPDVTGVEVVLTNGLHVTATLDRGLWGVWWPAAKGDVIGARLVVHTTAGDRDVDPVQAGLHWDR